MLGCFYFPEQSKLPIVDFADLKSISVLLIGEYLVYRLIDVLKHMKNKLMNELQF